jgi:hypothetical protein
MSAHQAPAAEGVSVAMPMDADDFVVPDLTVGPPQSIRSGGRTLGAQYVELAVEVVPRSEKARELGQKADWYAVACVRALLVVDPRNGTWTVRNDPRDGYYRQTRSGRYGQEIPLPRPLGFSLESARLPLYAPGGLSVAR